MEQLISIDRVYLLAAYMNAVVESVGDDGVEYWLGEYLWWMFESDVNHELACLRKPRKTMPDKVIVQAELTYHRFMVDASVVTIDEYNLMVRAEPGELTTVYLEGKPRIVGVED